MKLLSKLTGDLLECQKTVIDSNEATLQPSGIR